MKNNIILVGYMGCGKTTIGRKLSEILSVSFLDTDQWIEEKEGITVSEIFASKGESYFREMETECLKELLHREQINFCEEKKKDADSILEKTKIISVGGGLPVKEENQILLRKLGQVIYLKATADTIYERLREDTTRPLLQTSDPLTKIKDMICTREEKYRTVAHKIIEVDKKSIMEVVSEIIE